MYVVFISIPNVFVHACVWVLNMRDCRSRGWAVQSAAFTAMQKIKEKERHGGAVLKLLRSGAIKVSDMFESMFKHRRMWSDRPLSAACSVLWQREGAKIHPAPGRQSLWQPLLWWHQGCMRSDSGHGTLVDSPSGAVGGETHTHTETKFRHNPGEIQRVVTPDRWLASRVTKYIL